MELSRFVGILMMVEWFKSHRGGGVHIFLLTLIAVGVFGVGWGLGMAQAPESCFVGVPAGDSPTIEVEASLFEFTSGDVDNGKKVYVVRWNEEDKVGCANGVPEGNIVRSGSTFPSGIMHGSDGVGVYLEVTGSLTFTPLADYDNAPSRITVNDLDYVVAVPGPPPMPANNEQVEFDFGIRVLPAVADYQPQNVMAVPNTARDEIVVSWDAPALVAVEGGAFYSVRYKLAGTYTYFPEVFDAAMATSFTIADCSENTMITDCIPIERGKTYTVEVAQRNTDTMPVTLPSGSKQDWAQAYAEIPFADDYTGLPKITGISVVYSSGENFADEGRTAAVRQSALPSTWATVTLNTDSTPAADASVELIWDELVGTGKGEKADIFLVNYPSRDRSNPDAAVIRWHLENDQDSNNFSGKQRVHGAPDSILESEIETVNLRLVNFKGVDPDGSMKTFDFNIKDDNFNAVSFETVTEGANSIGVLEADSDIEVRASFYIATDSRCELSWSAELAATDEEKLTKMEASDFEPEMTGTGAFVFEAGEKISRQSFTINDDGVPEGLESLRISTSSISCAHTYDTDWLFGFNRAVTVRIQANDVPVVSSLVAGDAGGDSTDRLATVGWGLGGADVSEVAGFVVRWTPEVAGEVDAFYLTGNRVTWQTQEVVSASDRSVVFPTVGRLEAGKAYVVQVGVVTAVGAEPIFSSVLSRVTTSAEVSVSVTDARVLEGESFEVSVELSNVLSEDVIVEVGLAPGSGSDSAEAEDFVAGPESITIAAGETMGGPVSFVTVADTDEDAESLVLSASVSVNGVVVSPDSIALYIVEMLGAPPPAGIMVVAGDGASPVSDADRRFRVSWSAPAGVVVDSYELGWVEKPGDGSVPADGEWMVETVSVTDLAGVFPSGSVLYRASNTAETGMGLEAGGVYLVRVRSVVENEEEVWSEPVEVTLEDSVEVTYEVDTEQVAEGGTVTLTATLSSPLSEDVEVTWGVVTGDSSDAVGGQHSAEAADVTIAVPVTETLTAGQIELSKEFLANADADSDEDVFSPFVVLGGDIGEGVRPLVTITEPRSSGGGGSNVPTQNPTTQPLTMQTPTTQPPTTQPPTTQPTNPQPSASPNTQPGSSPGSGGAANQPAGSGGQPTNSGGGNSGTLPTVGGGGSGLPATGIPPSPGTGDQAQSSAGGFIDTVGTTHEANIDRLAAGGITRGCNPPSNTRFCPGRAVTRGEMATFMVRAFDLSVSESNLFADDDGNTHEGNINALASAEITRGCNPPENSRYCPDRPVTRAQMATFLARAMELAEGSGEFTDTADSPHANDINRIASVGITRGCNPPSNSRFCPDRAVTRGEMATFLIRAEDLET